MNKISSTYNVVLQCSCCMSLLRTSAFAWLMRFLFTVLYCSCPTRGRGPTTVLVRVLVQYDCFAAVPYKFTVRVRYADAIPLTIQKPPDDAPRAGLSSVWRSGWVFRDSEKKAQRMLFPHAEQGPQRRSCQNLLNGAFQFGQYTAS